MNARTSDDIVLRTELSLQDVEQTIWPVLLRPAVLWQPWVVWGTVIAAYLVITRGVPQAPAQGMALAATAGAASLAAVAFSVIIKRAGVLAATKRREGVVGSHEYTLRQDGLFERTTAGEHLTPWSRIKGLKPTREHLILETTGDAVHVIPKRAFASEAAQAQFCEALAQRLRAGHPAA